MTDLTTTDHEPPRLELEPGRLSAMRQQIDDLEFRLADSRQRQEEADGELKLLARKIEGWERYRQYQQNRERVLALRIRAEREQLRMEEDYGSNL